MEFLILDYALCLIEYSSFFFFLNSLLERRFANYLPIVAVIFMATTFTYFFSNARMSINSVMSLIILILGCSLLFKAKFIVKISYSLLLLFFLLIIDIISGNLFALVFDENYLAVFYSNFTYRLVSCLVIKVIDVLMIFVMQKVFKRVDKSLKSKYWALFSAVFLVLLLTSAIFMDFYSNLHQSKGLILLVFFISVTFLVLSLIVVYFFVEICSAFQRDKLLFTLEANNKAFEEALALQSSNSENLRKIRHDIVKHTSTAVALIEKGNVDDAADLLRNVSDTVGQIVSDNNVNTGNSVVDAIISSRAALCKRKDISFIYCIEPLDEIKIEAADLSSLLSNLLDNAVEAAEKTANGMIKIDIFKYKAYFDICIENSFLGKDTIIHSGTQLLSTKSDGAMHGYGTQIIKGIAEKYNGYVTWNDNEENFKYNVLLKI